MSWWKNVFGENSDDDTNPEQLPGFNPIHHSLPNPTQLPTWFELIPGKLSVRVYKHDIETLRGIVPCWSYITDGLWAFQQKELIFTLRRSDVDELVASPDAPAQGSQNVHQYIFAFFLEVYRFAEQGHLVYEGDCSWFGSQGFLGSSNWAAVVYVRPQQFEGIEVPSSLLAVILLTAEEFEVYKNFGLTRTISHLGRAYVYYPCPSWSERIAFFSRIYEGNAGKYFRTNAFDLGAWGRGKSISRSQTQIYPTVATTRTILCFVVTPIHTVIFASAIQCKCF